MMVDLRKEKQREYRKRWISKHPEQAKQCRKKWVEEHPDRQKELQKRWRAAHPEKGREAAKRWRESHPERAKEIDAQYRFAHREQRREYTRRFTKKHPDYGNKWKSERYKNNPDYWLIYNMRSSCAHFLQGYKSHRTLELTGCSLGFLKNHLESQFKPGMTWENRGKAWHVDHCIPLTWFVGLLHDPEWQKVAFHWTNLQPLWAKDNMAKGARYA